MRLIDADTLIEDLLYDVELDEKALDDMDFAGNRREIVQFDKDCKQNNIDILRRAPTIEIDTSNRNVRKWIPCSERMPDEHEWLGTKKFGTTISDEVYVTFENPKGERFCKHLSFQNGELSHYDQHHIDVWYKGSKPIAWMPLPTPYQPKEDES